MSLNQACAGRVYEPTQPYQVTREKIKEFAEAIGEPGSVYRDPAAARALGQPDVIAPPTFPIVLTMAANRRVFDDPEVGLDFDRVVHGDQRFSYERPVRAGDRLSCGCVLEDITTRGGHGFVTTRAELTDDRGELVVTVWSRLVVRGESADATR